MSRDRERPQQLPPQTGNIWTWKTIGPRVVVQQSEVCPTNEHEKMQKIVWFPGYKHEYYISFYYNYGYVISY